MNNIKQLRLARGINRAKLAHDVGVSPRHIAFLEDGARKPSITVALKLADLLGVHVDDIFTLEKEANL